MFKKYLKGIIFLFLAVIFIFGSIFLLKYSSKYLSREEITFREDSTIGYKVYLKDNNFFEEKYLDEGKVYITNLIDYIDVNFNYDINFNDFVSGTGVYYLKGIVSANIVNSDKEYWKREFNITEPKSIAKEDIKHYKFSENAKIDYQKFNNVLLDFIDQFNLSIDGKLTVEFVIENKLNSHSSVGGFYNKSATLLEIPLTKATIEVPITTSEVHKTSNTYGSLDNNLFKIYNRLKTCSLVIFSLGSVFLLIGVILLVKNLEKKSEYIKKRNKILKTYDSIIVNSHFHLDLSNYDVIEVSKFEELVDAYSEVRQPINFYEKNHKSTFILINNKTLWRYVLVEKN